ncbi:MAG: hypothetical protein V1816_01490 [Pseudomonadota bacterium]
MATEELKARIKALEDERDLLEAALPPHGLKPGHLQKIEALEEQIEALRAEASPE